MARETTGIRLTPKFEADIARVKELGKGAGVDFAYLGRESTGKVIAWGMAQIAEHGLPNARPLPVALPVAAERGDAKPLDAAAWPERVTRAMKLMGLSERTAAMAAGCSRALISNARLGRDKQPKSGPLLAWVVAVENVLT